MVERLPAFIREAERETPNQDLIESWLSGMYDRYAYENLVKWEYRDLRDEEHLIRSEFLRFKASFPAKGTLWQGELRRYAFDSDDEAIGALTRLEQERLQQAEADLISHVKEARGTVKKERRVMGVLLLEKLNETIRGLKGLFR